MDRAIFGEQPTFAQGDFNGLLDLVRGGLPCSKAHSGDLGASVEREVRWERHCRLWGVNEG